MIIICPSCNKRYAIEDTQLNGGRTVQCMSCSTVWWQEGILLLEQQVNNEKSAPKIEQNLGYFQNLLQNYRLDWIIFGAALLLVIFVLWSERAAFIDALPGGPEGSYRRAGTRTGAPIPGSQD